MYEDCEFSSTDTETINPDGTGSFKIMDYDGQCDIYKSRYTWEQKNNQFIYNETEAQERDDCEEDWIQVDLSDSDPVSCDILRITDSMFECEYIDQEYETSSIYKYILKK